MKILINLSSRLLCEALQTLMEKDAAIQTAVAHKLDPCSAFTPDKILFDGITLERCRPAHWNGAKIVLIDTGLREEEIVRLLCQHRLDGVISTGTDTQLFLKALKIIRDGQIWIDNSKIRSLLHTPPLLNNHADKENFSKREREIVLLIAEGVKNRDIAARLNISEQTVKTHISRIFRKADVTSRTQLVPLAQKFKLESSPLLHI
ncbi:MAG TPA: response regulator transcription factor [Desulfuromonadaceae bacterium]